MFREMRRKNQNLPLDETVRILNRGTSGILAVAGDDGYPYAVPLSYVFHDQMIYFHCAKAGHKIDAIANNNKVSFCVIDQDQVVSEELTTYFRSVIVFGKARIIEEETEKKSALETLAIKFAPDQDKELRSQLIEKDLKHVCLIEISIEHMTGKEAIELVKAKREQTTS